MIFTAIWITLAAVGGITELVALLNKRDGDTLSEHVWRIARIGDRRPTALVWAVRALIALTMIWLAGHFSMGWWTPSDPWPSVALPGHSIVGASGEIPHLQLVSLLVGTVLPIGVGIITTRKTKPGVKAVLLAAASAVSGLLTAYLQTPNGFDWDGAIISWIATFLAAVATHYGWWRPTGTAEIVQNRVGRTVPDGQSGRG